MGFYSDFMGFIVIQWDIHGIYPLVMTNSLLLNMTIEIVDLPIENGGSFHSCLSLPEHNQWNYEYPWTSIMNPWIKASFTEFISRFFLNSELLTLIEKRGFLLQFTCWTNYGWSFPDSSWASNILIIKASNHVHDGICALCVRWECWEQVAPNHYRSGAEH